MQKGQRLLVKKLIRVFSSIGRVVEYRIDADLVSFYQGQVVFGKLHEEKLYLLNIDKEFVEIDYNLLSQEHLLRREVSKAYDISKK